MVINRAINWMKSDQKPIKAKMREMSVATSISVAAIRLRLEWKVMEQVSSNLSKVDPAALQLVISIFISLKVLLLKYEFCFGWSIYWGIKSLFVLSTILESSDWKLPGAPLISREDWHFYSHHNLWSADADKQCYTSKGAQILNWGINYFEDLRLS